MPGPGNYSVDYKMQGGFKFGGKYKEKVEKGPGPGEYDYDNS